MSIQSVINEEALKVLSKQLAAGPAKEAAGLIAEKAAPRVIREAVASCTEALKNGSTAKPSSKPKAKPAAAAKPATKPSTGKQAAGGTPPKPKKAATNGKAPKGGKAAVPPAPPAAEGSPDSLEL